MAENSVENAGKFQKLKEQFLECSICMNIFDEAERKPRLLPCLHGLCYTCLHEMQRNNIVKCASCREEFPADNLEMFPVDRTRWDLLDFVRANTNVSNILCENCEEKQPASHRCQDCSHFLCGKCVDAHNRMQYITSKHTLFCLQKNAGNTDSVSRYVHQQYCEDHGKEKLLYYCSGRECGYPICNSCYVLKHSDNEEHTVSAIADVYETETKCLIEQSKLVQQRIDEAKRVTEIVEKTRLEVEENTTKAAEVTDAAFDICQKLLDRRREVHKQTLKEKSDQKQKVLAKQCQSLSSYIDCMQTDRAFLDQSLSAENKAGFLFIAPAIKRKFHSMLDQHLERKPAETPHIDFAKQSMLADSTRFVQTLGSIESSSLFPGNSKVHVPNVLQVNQEHQLQIQLYDRDNNHLTNDSVFVHVKVTLPTANAVGMPCSVGNGGTYKAEWVPTIEGRHLIQWFAFNGKEELCSREVDVTNPQPIQQGQADRDTEELTEETAHGPSGDRKDTPVVRKKRLFPRTRAAKVTYLSIHMDEHILHKDQFLSKDRMSLFNRRHAPPSDVRTGGHQYSYDWPAMAHAPQKYYRYGVRGSRPIRAPSNVYYEVEVDYTITQDLRKRWLVFEVGLAWEKAIGDLHYVGGKPQGWSVYINRSVANKDKLIYRYVNDNKPVHGHIFSSSKSGTTNVLTLGVNVDTPNKAITFVDPVSRKRLYRFEGVDTAQPLWPVFAVYNTDEVDVRVTLKSADGVYIPVDLLYPQ